MTGVIVNVMVEVLGILSVVTKEIKRNRASKLILGDISILLAYCCSEAIAKKLVGGRDIEDALERLDMATQEEALMATAESLKAIHGFGNLRDTLKAIEDRMRCMEGMLEGVAGGRLPGVDDRVRDTGAKTINSA